MRTAKALFAFLLLISLGLSATSISGNLSSYNPGGLVNITITNDNENAKSTTVTVNISNSSNYNFSCGSGLYDPTTNTVSISCILPINLHSGVWNITVFNSYNFSDDRNTTTQFVLNTTNMSISIEDPKSFAPNYSFTLYLNVTLWNGTFFDINTSNFAVIANVSGILNCSTTPTRFSTGNYSTACTLNNSVNASNYSLTGTYPSSSASDILTVNVSYSFPNIVLNASTIGMERGASGSINITVFSNSNIGDILNLTVSGCDGENITCSLNENPLNLTAFGRSNSTITVVAAAGANATSYNITINVTSLNSTSHSNKTTLIATVYPFHDFSLSVVGNAMADCLPGYTVTYNFSVANIGENASSYAFICGLNNSNFTCAFNTTNHSVSVPNGTSLSVSVNVTVLYSAPDGETLKATINVTDSLGLSKLLTGTAFKTTALGTIGNVTVTNVSQYVHFAGESYFFNVSINNTGNIDGDDTNFTINVSAYGSNWLVNSGGSIKVSNTSNFLTNNYSIMDNYSIANLSLVINNLSSGYLFFNVTIPSIASCQNSTVISVYVNSSKTASRFGQGNITVKIPCFSFSVVMNYSNSTEYLNFSIANITREGNTSLYFSNITFFIINQSNSKLMANNTNATLNTVYSNSTSNVDTWSSGAYVLNITGSTTPDTPYNLSYNFSFRGVFFIARWIGFSMPTLPSVASGTNFNVAIGSYFGNTSNVTNATVYSQKPTITYFNGGNCSSFPSVSGTAFTYTCTPTATTNSTYVVKAQIIAASCSSDFTCLFIPTHFTNGSSTVVITYSPTSSSSSSGTPSSSNTTSNLSSTNTTVVTATGLKFTLPSNVSLTVGQTITITLNNTNTSRQNITMNASEAGDYIHFSLTYVAPKNISGSSISSINMTLTPFKWAKPGIYTVSVTINSVSTTLTVTIPQSNDTKKIHRYVEVSKSRTNSMVTLTVKNRNSYSVFMNVTENISKQIAAYASNLTITSAINYTIIEQDPVIMWMMNMTSGQEKSIIYLAGGDLGNSNLFMEPNISEGRMSTGGGGGTTAAGGMDMWLIIGIIAVVVIAAAVVVYLFFLKPRGIKLPMKYGAFVKQEKKGEGALGVLKGITAKMMSIFKREKKEAPVGEKKGFLSRLPFTKKKAEVKEEPRKEEKKIEPGKPKPTKEDLLKKLNEVYKK